MRRSPACLLCLASFIATIASGSQEPLPYKELFKGDPKFGLVTGVHYAYGKLFFFDSPIPAASNGGDVYIWDPESGKARKVFQVQEQGVGALRAYGGKLYIPGPDAMEGWNLGNFYLSSDKGESFQKVRTIPVGVHIWDLCVWRGKLYASTGSVRDGQGYGAVCESEDGGQTWKESLIALPPDIKDKSQFGRCYALIPTEDALYASFIATNGKEVKPTHDREFYRFDGKVWNPVKLLPERIGTPFFGLRHREIGDCAFLLGRPNSYLLRKGKVSKLDGLQGLTTFMVAIRGDSLYAVATDPTAKRSSVYRASFSGVQSGKAKFELMFSLPEGEEGVALEVAKDGLFIGTRTKDGGRLLEVPLK